ncbi:3-deoxy-D-manno-octulosonic acid kinase [Glaciecola sp. 1036]|uniref:3-deoxy-D-manno-octulosonic acid kinase n=1 Tax=Alteromonadaceae TaxID=72275 RepID=UPI003D002012
MPISVRQISANEYILVSDPSYFDLIQDVHFDPDFLAENGMVIKVQSGRGKVFFFQLSDNQLVLRHYRRGGLVAKFSEDKFIWQGIENTRAFKELYILNLIQKQDILAPQPVAAKVQKKGPFYTCDILTKAIPETKELHQVLQEQIFSSQGWIAIGKQIRRLHNANVWHPDLNVKNILIDKQEQVFLIDFDKCKVRNDGNWKSDNLARLQRSILKQKNQYPVYHFSDENWHSLLDGYAKN